MFLVERDQETRAVSGRACFQLSGSSAYSSPLSPSCTAPGENTKQTEASKTSVNFSEGFIETEPSAHFEG